MDNKKEKNALSDLEQACLLMARAEQNISSIFKQKVVDRILQLGLIQLKPNSSKWMLTLKGELALSKKTVIQYPLHDGEGARDYNSILRSMDEKATNALMCAAMNERSFDKIPKNTARVLGQHILDTNFHRKFGSVLTEKYLKACEESLVFFNQMKERYAQENEVKHSVKA